MTYCHRVRKRLNLMETTKLNQKIISECKDFLSSVETREFLIAVSGGCDSSVLLHSMNNLKESYKLAIRTIHINHHYTNESDLYAEHCDTVSKKYGIEHVSKDIYLDNNSNIEEQLRDKRYKTILKTANKNEFILTGHHFDDQVETFFLRLMRGASSRGLSCMSMLNKINNKVIARPLLNITRLEIESYQSRNSVDFVEDKSNKLTKFDRNFLRIEIIPKLKTRWKSLNKIMKSNIKQQEINSIVLDNLIINKLSYCYHPDSNKLSIQKIQDENGYIQSELIHKWIYMETEVLLNHHQIEEILSSIIHTKKDSTPEFSFQNFSIRKYQGILYLYVGLEKNQYQKSKKWDLSDDLIFNKLTLKVSKLKELGLYKFLLSNKPVTVKRREGGEKIKLNSKFHQKLKKVFQSKNIPIWERDTYALIFVKEELIAAYGPNDIIISNSRH